MITWEQDLVRQVQEGQPGAFARLVKEFEPSLKHTLFQFLQDTDAADDTAQEAFLATLENIHLYDPDHRYFSWVYRIAINRALNQIKRQKFLEPMGDREVLCPAPAPDDVLEAKERRAQVSLGLSSLVLKYRLLLIMRHFLDLSYAEMAEFTGLPVTTVRSRLHTARALLKKELGALNESVEKPWTGQKKCPRSIRAGTSFPAK